MPNISLNQQLESLLSRLKQQPVRAHILILFLVGVGTYLGLGSKLDIMEPPIDKLAHFLCFAAFTLLFGRYLGNFAIAMILAVIVGCFLEFGQLYIVNRNFSYFDLLMNCTGAISCWVLSEILDF